jgi:hypothetical protein
MAKARGETGGGGNPQQAVKPPGGWRTARLYRRLLADAEVTALPAGPPAVAAVREEDLAGLPDGAQLYLRSAGVIGRTADWSLAMHSRGRFRLRRAWPRMPCEAWQYNSAVAVARVFWMRIDGAGVVPMLGRDCYLRGDGRMVGKLAGVLTVASGSGPECAVSELVTFLNDVVSQVTGRVFLDASAEFSWQPGDIRYNIAPRATAGPARPTSLSAAGGARFRR